MKRPVVFLTVLFVSILFSTVVVSTTISGICRSFYKENTEKGIQVKSSDKQGDQNFSEASAKI
jgi:hypothetical protein